MPALKTIAIIAAVTIAVPVVGIAAVGTAIAVDAESTTATVTRIVDGDTIDTTAGKVRLIGIDTPEEGQCGYEAASAALGAFAPVGSTVTLEHPGLHSDADKYDRPLRYVVTTEGDAGLHQIEGEWADARYDSTDGYDYHEREDEYHAADTAKWQDGTTACPSAQDSAPAPVVVEEQEDHAAEAAAAAAAVAAEQDEDEHATLSSAPKTSASAPAPAPVKPKPATAAPAPAKPTSVPAAPAPKAPASVYFANCDAVRAAGAAPIHAGDPGYSTKLDRDKDGVACEK